LSPDFTKQFSKRADFYSRYRPSYPGKLLNIVKRETGLHEGWIVADIGSGTGLLAKVFLKSGNKVFGVEPNDQMRSHADRNLAGFANFVSVNGTAERTTLPNSSVDLITVGQALHWFNPAKTIREFSRVSRPGGHLCVVYNEWKKGDGFMRAYARVIREYGKGRAKVPHADAKYLARFFRGGKYSEFRVSNEQVLSHKGLVGRLLSASYIPLPGVSNFERDVSRLFAKHSRKGKVRLRYDTSIFVGEVR